MHRTTWTLLGGTLVLLGLILAQAPAKAAGSVGQPAAPHVTIAITESQGMSTFSPGRRVITVGTMVTWKNTSDEKHDLTFTSGRIFHGDLGLGRSVSLVFTTPGTYRYLCDFHAGMSGVISVRRAGAATPGTSAQGGSASQGTSGEHDDHGERRTHDGHGSHGTGSVHDDRGRDGAGHA